MIRSDIDLLLKGLGIKRPRTLTQCRNLLNQLVEHGEEESNNDDEEDEDEDEDEEEEETEEKGEGEKESSSKNVDLLAAKTQEEAEEANPKKKRKIRAKVVYTRPATIEFAPIIHEALADKKQLIEELLALSPEDLSKLPTL